MNKIFSILAVAGLLLVSCNKNDASESGGITEEILYDTSETLAGSVFFASEDIPSYIREALEMRISKYASSAEEAGIIFYSDAGYALAGSPGEDDKIIARIDPDSAVILKAQYKNSVYELHDSECESSDETPDDNSDETATESGSGEFSTNYQSSPVPRSESASYLNTKIGGFVSWANAREKEKSAVLKETKENVISEYIGNSEISQIFDGEFNVDAKNFEFSHVTWSDPDKVSRHSSVSLNMNIIPFYAYSENENLSGDYYFINYTLLAHNKPMYDVYKKKHGLIVTYAHIFYGKAFKLRSQLLDQDGNPLGAERIDFLESPVPGPTEGSTSYTHGFSTNLSVSGQFGVSGGKFSGNITVGASWTWSNSRTEEFNDQTVSMYTSHKSPCDVNYDFTNMNIQEEDDTEKAIPKIARSDQNLKGTWCWHVKQTKDNDSAEHFKMRVIVIPIYGYEWRHATWSCEGFHDERIFYPHQNWEDFLNYGPGKVYEFDLKAPCRTLMGTISLANTKNSYLKNIRIRDISTEEIVATDNEAVKKDASTMLQVPVGTYDVLFDVYDGDTSAKKGSYIIRNVPVTAANNTARDTIDAELQ